MQGLDDPTAARFEDLVDMMDHSYELMQRAIFQYCLCVKVTGLPMDSKSFKALLIGFVETEFEDMYDRITPCVESNGSDVVVYAAMTKRNEK